jgi:hypothetical protein
VLHAADSAPGGKDYALVAHANNINSTRLYINGLRQQHPPESATNDVNADGKFRIYQDGAEVKLEVYDSSATASDVYAVEYLTDLPVTDIT